MFQVISGETPGLEWFGSYDHCSKKKPAHWLVKNQKKNNQSIAEDPESHMNYGE